MGNNTLGDLFKITSFGESHGNIIGVVIDGVPAGLKADIEFIQKELKMRRPGQYSLSSQRFEFDKVEVLSGVFNKFTTGAPLCLIIKNEAFDSRDYEKNKDKLRPSHSDYSAFKKFGGYADYRGSGRFSGRITASYVMAGAIAKQLLQRYNIFIFAFTKSIGTIIDAHSYNIDSLVSLISRIRKVKDNQDSIGGQIKCIVSNFPPGIGGPVFNGIESNLSKAIFSIPSIKGIEFGKGFKATEMKGSEHNDPWILVNESIRTTKNDSGGIIGGISTGMPIEFTVAVKPTASIGITQKTVNIKNMKEDTIKIEGKHDPCIVPRAIVVVEAITAIVLIDYLIKEGKIPSVLSA
jgi:chorismate synthase